ncbi:hypothetical protein [Acinetobacter pittii]|uniref:hypothetical protein n=1 Tax=Acinetobacter pittii TaxID=48296 RepID=UPI002A06ED21|nr:hypothetical protein [Acinetobacter pittii]MDX8161929.1 hypothetical protein [Acinetobacter pittii]
MKRNRTCLKILRYRKDHPFVFYFLLAYLGGIFIYILIFHVWFADYSKPMPLNEVGDFLAGVFSPLAFLFLYIGYKQNSESIRLQNEELKASTRALELQVKEMRESVEQQKVMAELQRTELEERHNSVAPIIKIQGLVMHTPKSLTFNITLKNISDNMAKRISVKSDELRTIKHYDLLAKNKDIDYFIDGSVEEHKRVLGLNSIERIFTIEYENELGRKFQKKLKVSYVLDNQKWVTSIKLIANNILSH